MPKELVWEAIGPEKYFAHAAWADGRGEVLIAGQNGLLRSVDDGATFGKIKPLKRPFFVAVCRAADGALHLGDTKGTLQTSRDGGATWVMAKFPRIGRVCSLLATARQTYALGPEKLFRWGLGAEDWFEEKPTPKEGDAVHQQLFADETGRLFIAGGSHAAGKGYVLTSTDGHAWGEWPTPPDAPGFCCGFARGGALYLGTQGGTIFFTGDQGKSWKTFELPEKVDQIYALWACEQTVAAIAQCSVFRSEDGGATWSNAFTAPGYWRPLEVLAPSARGFLYAVGTQQCFRCAEPKARATPVASLAKPEQVAAAHPASPKRALGAWDARLAALLEAWRATRDADLASLIDDVTKRAEPEEAAALRGLGGDTLQLAWLDLAGRATPADIAALAATVQEGHLPDIEQRWAALAHLPDDPRLAACAARWVASCPFSSTSSRPCWTVAFGLLDRCADARTTAVLEAAKKEGLPVTGKTMKTALEGALAKSLKKLPEQIRKMRRPLSTEHLALKAEVEGAL